MKEIKTGLIYKITNPIGEMYIGQTINWERRYKEYQKLKPPKQIKVYNSFVKHGFENHTFEILMENIPKESLNQMEVKFIKEYDSCNKGLNTGRMPPI